MRGRRRRTRAERLRDRRAGIDQYGRPLPRVAGTNPRALRSNSAAGGGATRASTGGDEADGHGGLNRGQWVGPHRNGAVDGPIQSGPDVSGPLADRSPREVGVVTEARSAEGNPAGVDDTG